MSIFQGAIFLCLATLIAGISPSPCFATTLDKLQTIPGVTVVFYEVSGKNVKEVRTALDRSGPKDRSGRRGDAYSAWKISWNWPRDEANQPDFSNMSVDYEITVTLPRWLDKENSTLEAQQLWDKFFAAIVKHELNHIQHVLDNKDQIVTEIQKAYKSNPRLTTSEANDIAQQVLLKIRGLDQKYDVQTIHGKKEGVRFS